MSLDHREVLHLPTQPTQPPSCTSFADLPYAAQLEVLSWCPNGATANALLNTCTEMSRLRQDPAAAAMLLLRCPYPVGYTAALASCAGCLGGVDPVVQQVLRLVTAGPDYSGPATAQTALLHAMLAAASGHSPAPTHWQPTPRDTFSLTGGHYAELIEAAFNGPHLAAIAALLGHVADAEAPAAVGVQALAAPQETQALVVQLLLWQRRTLVDTGREVRRSGFDTMECAIVLGEPDTVVVYLPGGHRAGRWKEEYTVAAPPAGCEALLRVLVGEGGETRTGVLTQALIEACRWGRPGHAGILLDHGADVDNGDGAAPGGFGMPIIAAHQGRGGAVVGPTLGLLLSRGAAVTLDIREAIAENHRQRVAGLQWMLEVVLSHEQRVDEAGMGGP